MKLSPQILGLSVDLARIVARRRKGLPLLWVSGDQKRGLIYELELPSFRKAGEPIAFIRLTKAQVKQLGVK